MALVFSKKREQEKEKTREINDLQTQIAELTFRLEKAIREQKETARLLASSELELARAQEQLRSLDAVKSEFITVAAHQLRTPLSAVKWILDTVLAHEYSDEKDLMELLKKAHTSTVRSISLVNDLLEVQSVQSGEEQYHFGAADIKAIIELILTEVKPQAEKHDLHFTSKFSGNTIVFGDEKKLMSLFQNIIENSIKYTLAGGTVAVSSEIEGKFLKVAITDSGIGIPQSQQNQIFTRFFRGTNALKIHNEGSGLGLYIAKQIVDKHQGKIWFISNEKDGTTFFVLLPITH